VGRRFRYWAFLMLVLLAAFPVLAEEIQLKDGTKVTGKITGVKDDVFQVKTSYGEIQIPRAEIVSITFPENQPKSAEAPMREVDENLEGNRYINRTAKFRLTVPEGWVLLPELREIRKDVAAALASKDKSLVFMVTRETFDGSLNSFKALAEVQYSTIFGSYQKLSESDLQLDGRKGIRLVLKGTKKADSAMKALVIILPSEGRYTRLSFITVEPLFDEALPVVEKMAMSYISLPQ